MQLFSRMAAALLERNAGGGEPLAPLHDRLKNRLAIARLVVQGDDVLGHLPRFDLTIYLLATLHKPG